MRKLRTSRLEKDLMFLYAAHTFALASTCGRRAVGCLFVDENHRVIGTGFNGTPRDTAHCIDVHCTGAGLESGVGLSVCDAIHAEANAFGDCKDILSVRVIYCTVSPCDDCVKLLLNTSALRLVFSELYPHKHAEKRWKSKNIRRTEPRTWELVEPPPLVLCPSLKVIRAETP